MKIFNPEILNWLFICRYMDFYRISGISLSKNYMIIFIRFNIDFGRLMPRGPSTVQFESSSTVNFHRPSSFIDRPVPPTVQIDRPSSFTDNPVSPTVNFHRPFRWSNRPQRPVSTAVYFDRPSSLNLSFFFKSYFR